MVAGEEREQVCGGCPGGEGGVGGQVRLALVQAEGGGGVGWRPAEEAFDLEVKEEALALVVEVVAWVGAVEQRGVPEGGDVQALEAVEPVVTQVVEVVEGRLGF